MGRGSKGARDNRGPVTGCKKKLHAFRHGKVYFVYTTEFRIVCGKQAINNMIRCMRLRKTGENMMETTAEGFFKEE